MSVAFILAGAVLFIVLATARLRLHPALALALAALGSGLALGMTPPELALHAANGFVGMLTGIGPIVLLGALIGMLLEQSGAARRLADLVVARAGAGRAPAAMAGLGWTVAIPVFCDTAFIMLAALAREVAARAGIAGTTTVAALAFGLYASHVMVPPTPGPVAAAALLGADLGRVILIGLPVSAAALAAGLARAMMFDRRAGTGGAPEFARPAPATVPPAAGRALLPLLAPLLLILLAAAAGLPSAPFGEGGLRAALLLAGHPAIALLVGLLLALALPGLAPRTLASPGGPLGRTLGNAAGVILVTAAGGAFAKVLAQSGVAERLGGGAADLGPGLLLPFLVAAALKTAQGSSTVAMVTGAGLVAPLLGGLGLADPAGRAFAAVALGAGAMVASHANDSYFWIVTRFGGLDAATGFRLITVGTLVQGGAALLALAILRRLV